VRRAWRLAVPLAGLACGFAVAFERGLAQRFAIQNRSMLPALRPGDRLLVSPLSLRLRPLRPGDLVVFRDPERRGQLAIKRVVGLPAEPTSGRAADPARVGSAAAGGASAPDLPSRPLGPRELLVAGDNLIESRDSRAYGPIARRRLVGRAWYRYWPPERRGRLAPLFL
jgi:signal peptidase I